MPSHEHDEKVETGLIAITVVVWVIAIILAIVFIIQLCREKRGEGIQKVL